MIVPFPQRLATTQPRNPHPLTLTLTPVKPNRMFRNGSRVPSRREKKKAKGKEKTLMLKKAYYVLLKVFIFYPYGVHVLCTYIAQ